MEKCSKIVKKKTDKTKSLLKYHENDVMKSDDVIILFLENIVFGIFERFLGVEELC